MYSKIYKKISTKSLLIWISIFVLILFVGIASRNELYNLDCVHQAQTQLQFKAQRIFSLRFLQVAQAQNQRQNQYATQKNISQSKQNFQSFEPTFSDKFKPKSQSSIKSSQLQQFKKYATVLTGVFMIFMQLFIYSQRFCRKKRVAFEQFDKTPGESQTYTTHLNNEQNTNKQKREIDMSEEYVGNDSIIKMRLRKQKKLNKNLNDSNDISEREHKEQIIPMQSCESKYNDSQKNQEQRGYEHQGVNHLSNGDSNLRESHNFILNVQRRDSSQQK